ncbi:MAG: hypothetical protein II001_02290 [Bacteroidales bacterium]|nr:hypothetical protein [Bacteroidales bacterium]
MTCFLLTSGYAQKESVFVQDTLNHWLTYNIPGQTVIDSLGIPDLEGEIEYWESDGNYHQKWDYFSLGLTLRVFSDTIGSASKVEYVKITDEPLITSTFVTTKGIRIGTPKKQVLDIYDVHIDKTYDVPHKVQNQLLIGNLYEGTIFNFHEDKVFTIEMGYFSE